jgi:hypothetical protein
VYTVPACSLLVSPCFTSFLSLSTESKANGTLRRRQKNFPMTYRQWRSSLCTHANNPLLLCSVGDLFSVSIPPPSPTRPSDVATTADIQSGRTLRKAAPPPPKERSARETSLDLIKSGGVQLRRAEPMATKAPEQVNQIASSSLSSLSFPHSDLEPSLRSYRTELRLQGVTQTVTPQTVTSLTTISSN